MHECVYIYLLKVNTRQWGGLYDTTYHFETIRYKIKINQTSNSKYNEEIYLRIQIGISDDRYTFTQLP